MKLTRFNVMLALFVYMLLNSFFFGMVLSGNRDSTLITFALIAVLVAKLIAVYVLYKVFKIGGNR